MKFLKNKGFVEARLEVSLVNLYLNGADLSRVVFALWAFYLAPILAVWDTGIGIADDEHARIFEAFTQADGGLARRYEGVGLGLAYPRRMADLMGGEVRVESTVGKGSRFIVTLPAPAAQGAAVQ